MRTSGNGTIMRNSHQSRSERRPRWLQWRQCHQTRVLLSAAGVTALLSALVLVPSPVDGLDVARDDAAISEAVTTALLMSDGTDSQLIDVRARDGVVSLVGEVRHLLAKERAAEIAKSIKGVRAVVDRLSVALVSGVDDRIEREIRQALRDESVADVWELQVGVQDGVVSLDGEVESQAEKSLTESAVKGIPGVRDVTSDILVAHVMNRPDNEVEAEIVGRLANDVWIDDFLMNVDVEDARAELSGTVASQAEKLRAVESARVGGVDVVVAERLEVNWLARDRYRKALTRETPSENALVAAVHDAMLYDPRIDSRDVWVSAAAGVVTLSGTVDSLSARRAAVQDARNTFGVQNVRDLLVVHPVAGTLEEQRGAALAGASHASFAPIVDSSGRPAVE